MPITLPSVMRCRRPSGLAWARLFGTVETVSYGLGVLASYLPSLEPITFVLTNGAEESTDWAREVAGVVRPPNLLLHQAADAAWRFLDLATGGSALRGTSDLALTREEALDLYGDEREENMQ